MKRKFIVFLSLCLTLSLSLVGLSACEKHEHVYNKEIATSEFIASEATCQEKATYYLSCECGEKGTETFESGELAAHNYTKQVATEDYLATPATHTKKATYYLSCECGEAGTETFESGETIAHTFNKEVATSDYLATDATCTAKATYYYSCDCGAAGTDTFESGSLLTHNYDKEVATSDYIATEATHNAKATYYFSCVCGAKGTDTFESGETIAHTFDKEVATAKYIATEATCRVKATYYFSCVCGAKGTDTFESGDFAEHDYADDWSYAKTHHWLVANCGCSFINSQYGEHSFVDGACEICNVAYGKVAFSGGDGTEANPYIIANAEELANMANVETFSYYKVKDGVKQIDLSDWTSIRLNGCFDGNNVKLINLTTRLFTHVGNNEAKEIYVKNFEVTINFSSSSHAALIKEIDNFGTTVFENVQIHGYIEGESNTAALYSFGTQNGSTSGSNYTVELKNVKIDATIVCVTAQPLAAFVAHAFAGSGNKLTLKLDSDTQFTGEVYSAGDKKYNEYVSIGDYEIYKDGQLINQVEIDTKPITKVVPVLGAEGYTITASDGVEKITVSITAQITAYDDNGDKIPNLVGITMTLSVKDITENLEGEVDIFGAFDSAEIINGAEKYDAQIVDGVLKLYVAQSANYASGAIRLQVQQYNADGDIISCGTLQIYNFVA